MYAFPSATWLKFQILWCWLSYLNMFSATAQKQEYVNTPQWVCELASKTGLLYHDWISTIEQGPITQKQDKHILDKWLRRAHWIQNKTSQAKLVAQRHSQDRQTWIHQATCNFSWITACSRLPQLDNTTVDSD